MKLPRILLPGAVLTIVRTFGLKGIVLRGVHEGRRRAGAFRIRPRFIPADLRPGSCFMIDEAALGTAVDHAVAIERANRVVKGEFEAYRWRWRSLPSMPKDWLLHPISGRFWPGQNGWWKTSHLDRERGDIKDLWEPARFAWAYDLIRAFIISRDDRYASTFHLLLRSFAESSPPFHGPHWSCGQETAIRAIALLYAEANLRDTPSSSDSAMLQIHSMLCASGERIADATGYAVSQMNNHGMSEAAGLICLGVRYKGVHPEARHWLRKGKRILERLVREQFAVDGWYIQHSFNYMRMALDQCIIAERALRSIGSGLSEGARTRLAAAMELLLGVVDFQTGHVPNHGANDGAFVHPITLAEYRDFRPVLTALAAILGRSLARNVRPDTEVLAWLRLPPPPEGPPISDGVYSGQSGWAAARIQRTLVFLRAGRYNSRPSHLDPLQVDVRIDGQEIIVDPGTFAYNMNPPWNNGLATAKVHNGPLLDDEEPGERGPRFLWYRWPAAELNAATLGPTGATMIGIVPNRLRRTVDVTASRVLVVDEVLADDARRVSIRWLLHPDADPSAVDVEGGSLVLRGEEGSVAGWYSPLYGLRVSSSYVEIERRAAFGARITTRISARQRNSIVHAPFASSATVLDAG